jgi:hypothetical protein
MPAIKGKVSSRSSLPGHKTGPPGEAEILALNPRRASKLTEMTGWIRVEPGTLNVECSESEIGLALAGVKPAWSEPGESVVYPEKYAHIPTLRKAYFYYRAVLHWRSSQIQVIVRRAENPVAGRLEVFAERNLKATHGIENGSTIELSL